MGTNTLCIRENKQLKNSDLSPGEETFFSLPPLNVLPRCTVFKAGSADSRVSQGCVPSASVVSGIRLDPDCLRQDEGMFEFICYPVACWQTLPAHLDLVPDVWVPAIRWLNTPPSIPPSLHQCWNTLKQILWGLAYSCSVLRRAKPAWNSLNISGKSVGTCQLL